MHTVSGVEFFHFWRNIKSMQLVIVDLLFPVYVKQMLPCNPFNVSDCFKYRTENPPSSPTECGLPLVSKPCKCFMSFTIYFQNYNKNLFFLSLPQVSLLLLFLLIFMDFFLHLDWWASGIHGVSYQIQLGSRCTFNPHHFNKNRWLFTILFVYNDKSLLIKVSIKYKLNFVGGHSLLGWYFLNPFKSQTGITFICT